MDVYGLEMSVVPDLQVSFSVTEENLLFETGLSGPLFLLNVSAALKGTYLYILFATVTICPAYLDQH